MRGNSNMKKLITLNGSKYFTFQQLLDGIKSDPRFNAITPELKKYETYIKSDNDVETFKFTKEAGKAAKVVVNSEDEEDYEEEDEKKEGDSFEWVHVDNEEQRKTYYGDFTLEYKGLSFTQHQYDCEIALGNILKFTPASSKYDDAEFEAFVNESFAELESKYMAEIIIMDSLLNSFINEYVLMAEMIG